MLYDVSFTTQKLVKKLDKRGKVIEEMRLDTPIKITALPHSAAMSYSNCDNFVISTHVEENHVRSSKRNDWASAATKKVERAASKSMAKSKPLSTGDGMTAKQRAAATGDLAAAVNA